MKLSHLSQIKFLVRFWWATRPIFNVTLEEEVHIQWSKVRCICLELAEEGNDTEWNELVNKYDKLLLIRNK